jgi:hypothetical protein
MGSDVYRFNTNPSINTEAVKNNHQSNNLKISKGDYKKYKN